MTWKITGAPGTGDDLLYSQAGTPTLDLRFASSKSLNDNVSGQNLIDFTRSGNATYFDADGVMQTAGTNTARFDHDPTTGESLGLLIEEQRTNLLTYSEQVDDASWSKSALLPFGSGSIANASSSPAGAQTADKITEDTSNAEHQVSRFYNITTSVTYTVSVYVKSAGRTFCRFGFTGTGFAGPTRSIFNLTAGTVALDAGGSPTITSVGNGWYRLTVTNTATSTTTAAIITQPTINESTSSYTGDGTSGIYIWGAQLEAGAFPTSYIPTTSAAVTRNADVATITGSNFSRWYSQSQGTVYYQGTVSKNLSSFPWWYDITDGTTGNSVGVYLFTNGIYGNVSLGGITAIPAAAVLLSPVPGSLIKHAFAVQALDSRSALNATLSVAQTSTVMPVVSQMVIGKRVSGSQMTGHIRRLAYFDRRLPNATLQAITS